MGTTGDQVLFTWLVVTLLHLSNQVVVTARLDFSSEWDSYRTSASPPRTHTWASLSSLLLGSFTCSSFVLASPTRLVRFRLHSYDTLGLVGGDLARRRRRRPTTPSTCPKCPASIQCCAVGMEKVNQRARVQPSQAGLSGPSALFDGIVRVLPTVRDEHIGWSLFQVSIHARVFDLTLQRVHHFYQLLGVSVWLLPSLVFIIHKSILLLICESWNYMMTRTSEQTEANSDMLSQFRLPCLPNSTIN